MILNIVPLILWIACKINIYKYETLSSVPLIKN